MKLPSALCVLSMLILFGCGDAGIQFEVSKELEIPYAIELSSDKVPFWEPLPDDVPLPDDLTAPDDVPLLDDVTVPDLEFGAFIFFFKEFVDLGADELSDYLKDASESTTLRINRMSYTISGIETEKPPKLLFSIGDGSGSLSIDRDSREPVVFKDREPEELVNVSEPEVFYENEDGDGKFLNTTFFAVPDKSNNFIEKLENAISGGSFLGLELVLSVSVRELDEFVITLYVDATVNVKEKL